MNPGIIKSMLMNQLAGRKDNNIDYQKYLKMYYHALEESKKLLKEADLLFSNDSFERAYFLGFAALEEISKSQLAADVFTGFIDEKEFISCWRDHKKKIERVKWVQIDANFPVYRELNGLGIKDFDYAKKLKSMYVDMDFISGEISSPEISISKEDALSIISAVRVGLHRIYVVTEEDGEQIGTKGFMK